MQLQQFFEQLCFGAQEIPKKFLNYFEVLQRLDAIGAQKPYKLKEGFAIGVLDVVREDLVFLKSFSHAKDLRLTLGHKGLYSGDVVLAQVRPRSTRARLVSLLVSPEVLALVYLEKVKGKIYAISLKSTQEKPLIVPLKARQKALNALPLHTVLRVNARDGEILEVLGVLEDEKIDEKIVLAQFDKDESFPKECLDLAQSFGKEVYPELYPHRRDLRDLPFCTIDPSDAKDHDDAIYFDWRCGVLYVAIADVSEYVSKESAIDKEAIKRGFSLYFPHKSIPMLPPNLSENICSLQEGKERLALVWEIALGDSEVKSAKLYEAIITNHCNLSYEAVDLFLQNQKELPLAIAKSIQGFYPYAKKLLQTRLQKGYTFFNDEVKLKLDENLALQEVVLQTEGESHHIVEEAMLLANIQSAKLLEKMGVVGIYRIHESITETKFQELLYQVKSLGFKEKIGLHNVHQSIQKIQQWAEEYQQRTEVDKMIIKAQNQAQYASENIGHFGLGFECYTHFTSPIRRYSDLCVHRILKEYLNQGKRLEYLTQENARLCKSLSDTEREIAKMEMEFKDRKFAHWAHRHLGERLVVSVLDSQYPVLCVAKEKIYGARIVLRESLNVEKFDTLEIVLEEVNLANARIYAKVCRR